MNPFEFVIAIVFLILYLSFKGVAQALIVMTGVPFAAVGAIWMLYAAKFNTSIAVWVGMIALAGLTKPASGVRIGTRARPLFVTVFPTIVVFACGGSASFAYVLGTMPAPLLSQRESRITTPVALVPE